MICSRLMKQHAAQMQNNVRKAVRVLTAHDSDGATLCIRCHVEQPVILRGQSKSADEHLSVAMYGRHEVVQHVRVKRRRKELTVSVPLGPCKPPTGLLATTFGSLIYLFIL